RNCGNGPLHLAGYYASTHFFIGSGSFSAPLELPSNNSTSFLVGFAPAGAGPLSGTVTILSDAPGSPTVLALYGTGLAAPVTTGTISISATLNGQPFTWPFTYSMTGPDGTQTYGSVPLTITSRPAGSYTASTTQAPGGGSLTSITPSA